MQKPPAVFVCHTTVSSSSVVVSHAPGVDVTSLYDAFDHHRRELRHAAEAIHREPERCGLRVGGDRVTGDVRHPAAADEVGQVPEEWTGDPDMVGRRFRRELDAADAQPARGTLHDLGRKAGGVVDRLDPPSARDAVHHEVRGQRPDGHRKHDGYKCSDEGDRPEGPPRPMVSHASNAGGTVKGVCTLGHEEAPGRRTGRGVLCCGVDAD